MKKHVLLLASDASLKTFELLGRMPWLRAYFRSGWAFFIPYLVGYLIYFFAKWPINAGAGWRPPLVHVYWTLHVLHVGCAVCGYRCWSIFVKSWEEIRCFRRADASGSSPSIFRCSRWAPLTMRVLPWILLALFFYTPGVDLEFPSDSWDHLRRINEWSGHYLVSDHPSWFKWSYFFTYSLIGHVDPAHQLGWLNVYYVAVCLMLCWQYYLLARAVGLDERCGLVFVLLQACLFGNNVFSFYRYYGISSSIFAQLGAVALTRIACETASLLGPRKASSLLHAGIGATLLMCFVAFNHAQGVAIAALGIVAVAIWRLIAWKRLTSWWLLGGTIAVNIVAMRYWPRNDALDEVYRPSGILTSAGTFNFMPSGMVFERTLQILGILGIMNFLIGAILIVKNHLAGWLTVVPVLVFCLPCTAIPMANALASRGAPLTEILVFHRMFFAIPPFLAFIVFIREYFRQAPVSTRPTSGARPSLSFALVLFVLAVSMTASAGRPFYNRFWHVSSRTPADLAMRPAWSFFAEQSRITTPSASVSFVTTSHLAFVRAAQGPMPAFNALVERIYRPEIPPVRDLEGIYALVRSAEHGRYILAAPPASVNFSAHSFAALCSHHWFESEVPLAYAGTPEIYAANRHDRIPSKVKIP